LGDLSNRNDPSDASDIRELVKKGNLGANASVVGVENKANRTNPIAIMMLVLFAVLLAPCWLLSVATFVVRRRGVDFVFLLGSVMPNQTSSCEN
jgi:hypothetical protein